MPATITYTVVPPIRNGPYPLQPSDFIELVKRVTPPEYWRPLLGVQT